MHLVRSPRRRLVARLAGAVTVELNLEASRKGHGLFDLEIEGKAGDCVPTFVSDLLEGRLWLP